MINQLNVLSGPGEGVPVGSGGGLGTRTGARLSSLPVNAAGLTLNTASEADGGQFDDREDSTEVIYTEK